MLTQKDLIKGAIAFIFIIIVFASWYFLSKNNKIVFGPFIDEPQVFVSDNSFAVVYQKNDSYFVNVNKNIYGPYRQVKMKSITDESFGFSYLDKDNNWYVNIDNAIAGPYESVGEVSLEKNNFGFYYEKDGEWFADVNNKIYGPYLAIKNMAIFEENLIFTYLKDDNKEYIFTNDEEEELSYDEIENVSASLGGVAYVYLMAGEKFINFNGKMFGPYNSGVPIYLFNNGFIFWYLDQKDLLVNFNDIILGPYEAFNILKNSQSVSFYYKKSNNDHYYVSSNNKAFGPYDYSFVNGSISRKKIGLSYLDGNNWYAVIASPK